MNPADPRPPAEIDPIARLDGLAQAELVRRGELTPLELVDAAITRAEKLDPVLHAVVLPAFERAREQAAAGPPAGPFRGVPFLMKDIGGEEAGLPCWQGMRVLRDAGLREPRDSYFTERCRAAGLVSLGRTNTPELALLPTTEPEAFGATRNPWDPERMPGGSSGGAAAAVASGMVPLAHASDGGGSIRIPAALCGLVGLKPTRGRCSFGPGRGERWSGFSCELVVSRSVRDTAAFLDAAAGRMPGDPYTAPPPERPFLDAVRGGAGRLRIGLLAEPFREGLEVDPECFEAARIAARALEELGHRVEPAWPEALADGSIMGSYITVVACNVARALEAVGSRLGRVLGPDDVEPLTWAIAERGRATPVTDFLAALEGVHALGRRLEAWWAEGFDLLLSPATARPAAPLGEIRSTREEPFAAFARAAPYGAFTAPFNQSGQPAISVPVHWTASGLPVGAQLVAEQGREDLLLAVAAELERALPWADRWPPVHA